MSRPPPRGYGPGPNKMSEMNMFKAKISKFRRRRPDLDKPIRPVTAYDVFFRNTYPAIKKERPHLLQCQIYSEIARMWREGTCWEDRQICYDWADWEKETYDLAMEDWRPRREAQKRQEETEKLKSNKDQSRAELLRKFGVNPTEDPNHLPQLQAEIPIPDDNCNIQ